MIPILKAACLLIYALGLAAASGLLPESLSFMAPLTAVLLAGHLLETVIMFRYIKRYLGPLAISIVLSLLYGLLHWVPLKRQATQA